MNRKSIFISFGVTCLAILAGYGVSKTVSDDTDLKVLTLHNVEALADGEDATWGGWNNFWKGQGFWKDEEKIREQYPKKTETGGGGSGSHGSTSVSGEGYHNQENPNGRTDIRCTNGNENCSPISC